MIAYRLLVGQNAMLYWDKIEPFITPALEAGALTADMLKARILADHVFGLVILVDGEIKGFLSAHFRPGACSLILEILTLGGKDMHLWAKETMGTLEQIAHHAGASQIVFETRRKASRFLAELGFCEIATVYRRHIQWDGTQTGLHLQAPVPLGRLSNPI